MPKRKGANGKGTVHKDKDGVWWAQLPPGPDGSRPRRKFKTQREAQAWLDEMLAQRKAGRDLARKTSTVADLLEDHLATLRIHRRHSTVQRAQTSANHITALIGRIKLDAVTPTMVQRLANELSIHGPVATRAALALLRQAYDRVIPERVTTNPVQWRKLTLRPHVPSERIPLTPAQVQALLVAADDLEARGGRIHLSVFTWLTALLGVRRGEAAGVRWADLDLVRGEWRLQSQAAATEDGLQPGQPTKRAASNRTLPLGPRLVARLKLHQQMQNAERLRAGKRWHRTDLVLCDVDGSCYRDLSRFNTDLEQIAEAAGVPHVHPHLLRHTFATLIGDAGIPEATLAALLGHARKGTTARYTHATPSRMRQAVESFEALIFGATATEQREVV